MNGSNGGAIIFLPQYNIRSAHTLSLNVYTLFPKLFHEPMALRTKGNE